MEKLVGHWAWEIEEYLQNFKTKSGLPIFCWMFDETSQRHPDSYGTCLNYTEFLEAYDAATFTKDEWLDSAKYWLDIECYVSKSYATKREAIQNIRKSMRSRYITTIKIVNEKKFNLATGKYLTSKKPFHLHLSN